MFYYETGEDVRPGDRCRTDNGDLAIILKIIEPNTPQADDFDCPEGGFLYLGNMGEPNYPVLVTSRDGGEWELTFVERGEVPPGWWR